ncbi:unnamed protein product [Dicrocoelium dendriticum]|nr:unnamed protein product [Dicrocoelium dendriticum]
MDNQIQPHESENTSFLQELGDPIASGYYNNHQTTHQNSDFPEGIVNASDSVSLYSQPLYGHGQPASPRHVDPKSFCEPPGVFASNLPSTWNNGIARQPSGYPSSSVSQRPYYWPSGSSCPTLSYPSQTTSSYREAPPLTSSRRFPLYAPSVISNVHSSDETTPPVTCAIPVCGDLPKVSPSDLYSSSHCFQSPTNSFSQHELAGSSGRVVDPTYHAYSSNLEELRVVRDRIAALHQISATNPSVQQELMFLKDRLRSLESNSCVSQQLSAELLDRTKADSSRHTEIPHSVTITLQPTGPSSSNSSFPTYVHPRVPSSSTDEMVYPRRTGTTGSQLTDDLRPCGDGRVTGDSFLFSNVAGEVNSKSASRSCELANAPLEHFTTTLTPTVDASGTPVCTTPLTFLPDALPPTPATNDSLSDRFSEHSITSACLSRSEYVERANELSLCGTSEPPSTVHLFDPTAVESHIGNSVVRTTGSAAHDDAVGRVQQIAITTVSVHPIPTGRSTFHYRQADAPHPAQFAAGCFSNNFGRYTDSSEFTDGSPGAHAPHFYQPTGRPFVVYQHNTVDQPPDPYHYHGFQTRYPSTPKTIQLPAAVQCSPVPGLRSPLHGTVISPVGSVPTRAPFEVEKCNGIVGGELTSPYLPILPKIPGSPSPSKSGPLKSRRGNALDREARNERRRQQRLRKKQEEAAQQQNDAAADANSEADSTLSPVVSPLAAKRSRPPPRKASDPDSLERVEPENDNTHALGTRDSAIPLDDNGQTMSPKSKKRRSSVRAILPKQSKKNKVKEATTDQPIERTPKDDLIIEDSPGLAQSPVQKSIALTEESAPAKQLRIVRARPPRPKKKKPLPTLIRKKRRSAFYGNESDSEPDISGRLGGRAPSGKSCTPVVDAVSADRKRRSERTAGDRKRYTVDLELNLSDDSDTAGNEEIATLNSDTLTGMAEDNDFKVVEYVLGRRVTKRVTKKVIQQDVADGVSDTTHPTDDASAVTSQILEEEEDVEEFYLKYKGYSYLHCEWRALDEIDDPRIRPKLRRFEIKQANSVQVEDDDVVLFNPDYVEVERVLDMKVYRNGQLISSDKLLPESEQGSVVDLVELRKQRKRERERNRARAVREAKARLKAEAESSMASQDSLGRSTPITEEPISESNASKDALGVTLDELDESVESTAERKRSDSELTEETKGDDATVMQSCCPSLSTSSRNLINPVTLPKTDALFKSVDPSDRAIADEATSPASTVVSMASITQVTTDPASAKPPDRASDDDSDHSTGTRSPVTVTYYLVKWRSLPYEDATWELAQDVDPAKVKEFLKWRTPSKIVPAARDNDYKIIRPDASTWRPIEAGKVYKNDNKLRDYQLEGVNWLTYCWFHHRNCILADEMGLGKTVQSVAFLLEIAKAGVQGPFLIIVPLSTVANWQREFENWSDLNVVVYHGSSTSRNMIQEYEIFYKRRSSDSAVRHDVYKFHSLVTTFEILMTDIEFFGQIHWVAAVIDEAHRLKNKKCKLGEGLRYLELDHRVLLTGTPLQNNVEELFGLLNFLEPDRFNCSSTFVAEYGDLKTEEQVESLKALLKPMMLRRLKEDVEKSLAPKEETIVEVELTNIQKKYYRAIMERNFAFLCKGSTYSNAPNLMNIMMELRKCCNHPFLIKGAEDAILEEMRSQPNFDQPLTEDSLTFHAMVYASGKLVLIHKLLPKLRANGHKVLIFSQMIRVLDILEDYLIHQRFPFERIDGRIHGPLRQEAIDRFTADPDKFVFLLCTKAGGLGINLTAADVVIIYDSDWNPQNDLQAQARCHRIGQQKMVKVYRLITRNTYEREMFDRASLKLGLDRAVLQSMGSKEARQAQMSKKEIEELLKKGAYGALMDDDQAGEDFCEQDIDKILQSRSRVVQLEQGEKNSTFSKATFSMSDNRSDIELDDPNFWQKWAKKAGVDETAGAAKDLILKTPRQRRQVSRYSSLAANEPNFANPPSCDNSEAEDDGTAQSSGEDTIVPGSGGRGRFRRCRRQRRHSHHPSQLFSGRRASHVSLSENPQSPNNKPPRIDPLDRADLFRVERCLLTWPWGQWERGLASFPFKRSLTPVELAYHASAVLAYALRFMPPSADTRIRTTIITLTRPHIWNLSIEEVAKAVAKATSRASRGLRVFDVVNDKEAADASHTATLPKSEDLSCQVDALVDSPLTNEAPGTPALSGAVSVDAPRECAATADRVTASLSVEHRHMTPVHPSETVSALPAEEEPVESPASCGSLGDDRLLKESFQQEATHTSRNQSTAEHIASDLIETQSVTSEKPDDDIPDTAAEEKSSDVANISPKTACFDPDYLLPCDSFRKHMQRHSARLLNRVAFLLFLQCEVVGIEQTAELTAGRLSHTDFPDLYASLPPLEAIDSELPAPWWDACCDKCLLLGVLKHGWEKYMAIRLDPKLCFYSRAISLLSDSDDVKPSDLIDNSDLKQQPASPVSSDATARADASKSDDESTAAAKLEEGTRDLTPLVDDPKDPHSSPSSPLAPNIKEERLESAFAPVDMLIDAKGCDDQSSAAEDENALDEAPPDALLSVLMFPAVADLNSRARKLVGFFVRIKNQLEFDMHRRLSVEDDEDSPSQVPNIRLSENRAIKWTRREEADFYRVVSSFGVEFTPVSLSESERKESKTPNAVKRRYNWYNFRQLANITRKTDDALTEYFHAFYRMCQRVCKRPLTEFVGLASTAATTTTSGSSPFGAEVPVEPISEERANRCLSRIDLLARIRNEILTHPQLLKRLSLCQRGSEIPGWWIPGKHDGELLRAAAKHGLARTDLNILTDPEFSFCRVVNLIREKLVQESAVIDCPGELSDNPMHRSNIALAAASAAKAVMAQLEKDSPRPFSPSKLTTSADSSALRSENGLGSVFGPDSLTPRVNAHSERDSAIIDSMQSKRNDPSADESSERLDLCATKEGHVDPEIAPMESAPDSCGGAADEPHLLSKKAESKAGSTFALKATPNLRSKDASKEDISKFISGAESLSAEWSVKYATNLATAWPKDRTIQHRLELICQTIETNEWPAPRRYLPAATGSSTSVLDPKGTTTTDPKLASYTTAYTTVRHPAVAHSAFPISLSHKLQASYGMFHSSNATKHHHPGVPRPIPIESPKQLNFSNSLLRSPPAPSEDGSFQSMDVSGGGDSGSFDSSHPLNLVSSPNSSAHRGYDPYKSRTHASVILTPTSPTSAEDYSKSAAASFNFDGSPNSASFTSSGSIAPPTSRGRGRGRGRGSRGSRLLGARQRLSSASQRGVYGSTSRLSASPHSPTSGGDYHNRSTSLTRDGMKRNCGQVNRDSEDFLSPSDRHHRGMPPPNLTSAPRSLPGGRGRKRKLDSPRNSMDFSTVSHRGGASHSKRERNDPSGSGAELPSKVSKSSSRARGSSASGSDVWEIRVPVISLVDGSLIYGDKAPKRRNLEAWLEANPNYMPYSVEMEDRVIYSRVAGARGQDTNNMEALAYKHYLSSLIASATAGLHPSLTQSGGTSSNSANAAASLASQQQQLLQAQQQQILQAFGAYARHPAYASLIASALGNWQAANFVAASSFIPNSLEQPTGTVTATTTSTHTSSTTPSTMSTRARSAAARLQDSPGPTDIPEGSATGTGSSLSNSRPASPEPVASVSGNPSFGGMESVISAAYKQATANLAYMYNPLAAAAAYSQMMFSSVANAAGTDASASNPAGLAGQQAALASLYANYMLSAKQTQQQMKQQLGAWDQQRLQQQQQLASLASGLAAACSGTSDLDSSSLLSMFTGIGARPTNTTASSSGTMCSESVPLSTVQPVASHSQTPPNSQSPHPSSPVNLADPGHPSSPDAASHDVTDSKNESQPSDTDQNQAILDLSK